MPDLVCLGEILVDLVPMEQGKHLREVRFFEKTAGGAPANVAVGFSRLGGSSGFIGKVGRDEFGCFLFETLGQAGVDTRYLYRTGEALTGLSFVSLRDDGERDFLFYRHPAADMLLERREIPTAYLDVARIFHFGSVSLIAEPVREATLVAAEYAARKQLLVSYDPNLRPQLWPSLDAARDGILTGLSYAIVLKVSEEELSFLTSGRSTAEAAASLFSAYPQLRLVAVTRGCNGCELHLARRVVTVPGAKVPVVDTTGAGDGFTAGLLYILCQGLVNGDKALDWDAPDDFWYAAGQFANAVGALVVSKRGGIPAMPNLAETRGFLSCKFAGHLKKKALHSLWPKNS